MADWYDTLAGELEDFLTNCILCGGDMDTCTRDGHHFTATADILLITLTTIR